MIMRRSLPYRFARILVRKDGKLAWYGPTLCVRHEGLLREGEISPEQYEAKRNTAAQLYGGVEPPVLSSARSWQEAEFYFNNMDLSQ